MGVRNARRSGGRRSLALVAVILAGALASAWPQMVCAQVPTQVPVGPMGPPPMNPLDRPVGPLDKGKPPRTPGAPETEIIPSLSLSERYDSNVFFITEGQNLEDFVTTVIPRLDVKHDGDHLAGNIYAAATGEAYVRNPGLNYVAPSGGFRAELDRSVQRLIPKAKLMLRDDFVFTPRPPAFAAPESGSVAPDAFVRGIQASRANSYSNMGEIRGSYALTPSTAWQASYSNQIIRFGNQFVTPILGRYFSTMFQTVQTGPVFELTPRDTVNLTYQYQQGDFDGGGFGGGFTTQGGFAGYKRALTQTLSFEGSLGASLVQPANSIQYTGSAFLEWRGESSMAKGGYSRAVVPSFFVGGLPLLSEVVSGTASQRFSELITAFVAADYADNKSVPDPVLVFRSFMARTGVDYILTRWATANVSYSYSEFKYSLFGFNAAFDRHQLMFTIRMEWK